MTIEWVPASANNPNDNDVVLVTCENLKSKATIVTVSQRMYFHGYYWYGISDNYRVMAWAVLPEPYSL